MILWGMGVAARASRNIQGAGGGWIEEASCSYLLLEDPRVFS